MGLTGAGAMQSDTAQNRCKPALCASPFPVGRSCTHLHAVAQQQRLQVLHQLAVVAVVPVAARRVVPHHQLQRCGRGGRTKCGQRRAGSKGQHTWFA
jgi:hypothetical protein